MLIGLSRVVVCVTALSIVGLWHSALAQGSPKVSQDIAEVVGAAEQEVSKFVSLEKMVGDAGGAFAVNEPGRYINSAFLVDETGTVKTFIPSNLLQNFGSSGFDASAEITTVGSGIGQGDASGGFIAENLEQTVFDFVFQNKTKGDLQILFFNFGASKDILHRITYKHRYNIDGSGLSDPGIIGALSNWVERIGASDTDVVVYVGNIGVREFKQEALSKKGRNAGVTGWAYGAFGVVFEASKDAVTRKYVYSVGKSDTIDVKSLKIWSEQLSDGLDESFDSIPRVSSLGMTETAELLPAYRIGAE